MLVALRSVERWGVSNWKGLALVEVEVEKLEVRSTSNLRIQAIEIEAIDT